MPANKSIERGSAHVLLLLLLVLAVISTIGIVTHKYIQSQGRVEGVFTMFRNNAYQLTLVQGISPVTNNHTPVITVYSSKAATVTYSGGCTSSTSSLVTGNNFIQLNYLVDGTYNCTLTGTLNKKNQASLIIPTFEVRSGVTNVTPTPTPSISPTLTPLPTPTPTPAPPLTNAINKRVLVLIYDPYIGSQRLTTYMGWNSYDTLNDAFIADMKSSTGNVVNYTITERVVVDGYPVKADGFQYNDTTYLDCANSGGSRCHSPDLADYRKMIDQVDACGKRNRGEIDELWIWGAPWFGYWESNLAGPNAYFYNSSPTTGTTCQKLLPIMGFSYERGEAEMFEDMGHRLESEMRRVFGGWVADEGTFWNRFTLLDVDKSGRGGCGNAHNAVNASSNSGYDRTNSRTVRSSCDDFLNYPNLSGNFSEVNCNAWGCSALGYLKWWFSHVPNKSGSYNNINNNWWEYVVNLP